MKDGQETGGIEITPSNAKAPFEVRPSNQKRVLEFEKTGNTTAPPEKAKGPSDQAWYKKNAGPGYSVY